MMDRGKGGLISFECEGCGEVLDTNTKDFEVANGIRQREGWQAKSFSGSVGTVWSHFCKDCAHD
jgi:hypothetical protein